MLATIEYKVLYFSYFTPVAYVLELYSLEHYLNPSDHTLVSFHKERNQSK